MMRAAGLAALGLLTVATSPALAFKEPGHRAIEAAAYEQLLEDKDSAVREVLDVLVNAGALAPPMGPSPDSSEAIGSRYEFFGPQQQPLLSHMPDHFLDRQLESDRQCFHFNARSAYVTALPGPYQLLTEGHQKHEIPVPIGLVVDAYKECLNLADLLFRNIVYTPVKSRHDGIGIYELMHLIEDSYADSHVARTSSGRIIYVKPWNLRSGFRYFLGNALGPPVQLHFSDRHHLTAETRDSGYALGPYDDDFELDEDGLKEDRASYTRRIKKCLTEATLRLPRDEPGIAEEDWRARKQAFEQAKKNGLPPPERQEPRQANMQDLQTDMVIPRSCLSNRARRASHAIRDLLVLLADLLKGYTPIDPVLMPAVQEYKGMAAKWQTYRCTYLAHVDPTVSNCPFLPVGAADMSLQPHALRFPTSPELQGDKAYSSPEFKTKIFRTAGAGLTTELRSGTPLWLGVDLFASRDPTSHHALNLLLDTLSWGVQVRLPLEDEEGEKPVGIAGDIGPGLPLPVSELLGLDELQMYAGLRLRAAYTVRSIFSGETRHAVELGFGGVSLDFVVGQRVWFGIDAPRFTYTYDFWAQRATQTPTLFSFSGGIATDAF